MPMVATKAPYTLLIVEDDDPVNPREDCDNFGKMVCWHRRYNLGDKHDFEEPKDFLSKMLFNMYSSYPDSAYGKPVYDFIKAGSAADAKLNYNRSTHEWELLENNYWGDGKDWFVESSYPAALKGKEVPDWFLENCINALKSNEMLDLLNQFGEYVILPLYLYDHSGITMSTANFSCPWDSGQVGWIYADRKMIEKEYESLAPETMEKARGLLESEVKTYDYYLTGQTYGFQLFEGDLETDSCWGFLGDIRELQDEVKEYMPEGFEDIVENLKYEYGDFDIDEYLEEVMQTEETDEQEDENGEEP